MPEIRRARFDEMPVIRNLAIEIYSDTFSSMNTPENMQAFFESEYNLPKMQAEWHEPGSLYFVAVVDNMYAGYLRLRTNREVEHLLGSNTIELHRLYVHRDFQDQKLGSKFMNHALEISKDLKYEWIWLGVWEKNFKAQAFYAKWGFERFSEHTFLMGDDAQTDWLLKRKV
jgi:ribosomal protein S18 acetylase RimI-like enzyme